MHHVYEVCTGETCMRKACLCEYVGVALCDGMEARNIQLGGRGT